MDKTTPRAAAVKPPPNSLIEARARLETVQWAFQAFLNILTQCEDPLAVSPRDLHALLYPLDLEMEATLDELRELAEVLGGGVAA